MAIIAVKSTSKMGKVCQFACEKMNIARSVAKKAQYKEQLQVGGVIQQSLVEFCNFLSKGRKKGK